MAYRRAISRRRLNLFCRPPLPSLSPFPHNNNNNNKQDQLNNGVRVPLNTNGYFFNTNGYRNMSTSSIEGSSSDQIGYVTDIVTGEVASPVMGEMAVAGGKVISEVAVAAADSAYPVAALQYFIEAVHNVTGCNWWASIALTTLMIRGATIPLLINQLRATTKLSILRPELDQIKDEMQEKGMAEGQEKMKALFKQHGVTPFTPLKGLLFQGPVFISFFLAISNMVEKVPSFKEGGAFWFTDLTTPDSLYIFPALTALSFWITVECNMQEGMEGNPAAKTMKKVSRVFAAVTIPITMNFPKALFCYWVTSNLFSLAYGAVIRAPGVKEFLKIPKVPAAPPSNKPQLSFMEQMKQFMEASKKKAAQQATSSQQALSLPSSTTKSDGIRKVPSSAVLSQRLKSLERQVKSKKKNKKR